MFYYREDSLDPSAPTRPPVALSPTETATEMYRNSIANVRKSGKQAVACPQTTATYASKTDKGEVNVVIVKRALKQAHLLTNFIH